MRSLTNKVSMDNIVLGYKRLIKIKGKETSLLAQKIMLFFSRIQQIFLHSNL